jgi:hypothetical protein
MTDDNTIEKIDVGDISIVAKGYGEVIKVKDNGDIFMKDRGEKTPSGPLARMALRAKACPRG